MRLITRRLTPLAVAACVLLTPVTAGARTTAKEITTSKANGVGYLKSLQLSNGSLGTD
jgi:negative regulator of sigma E activity